MSGLNVPSYVAAGFPYLAIKTLEPLRAEKVIQRELSLYNEDEPEEEQMFLYRWDINKNFYDFQSEQVTISENVQISSAFQKFITNSKRYGVLIINNFNESINAGITQLLLNYTGKLKARNLTVVFIDCSFNKLKPDLLRLVQFIDLELPTAEELYGIAKNCYDAVRAQVGDTMMDEELRWIGEQARGLVEFEAENTFARSCSMNGGRIELQDVYDAKASIIKENAALEIFQDKVSFDDVGGLENAKYWCNKTVNHPYSKGALLTGVPGSGKTLFAKALASETDRLCVVLKFGRMFDKHVGGTEEKVELTKKTIDSLGKIVLMIDEVDKVVGGSFGGGGKTTGNEVSMRAIGSFLSWMQDRKSGDAYILATCNNVIAMVDAFPEFFRSGRWDIILFVDVPNPEERKAICEIKGKLFGVKGAPTMDSLDQWTGSDIEQLYKTAGMLGCDLEEAKQYVMPLHKTAGNAMEAIREWAKDRTIPASKSLDAASLVENATRSIKTMKNKGKKKSKKKS
jgi:AAA+ superfamily predicted ATPase